MPFPCQSSSAFLPSFQELFSTTERADQHPLFCSSSGQGQGGGGDPELGLGGGWPETGWICGWPVAAHGRFTGRGAQPRQAKSLSGGAWISQHSLKLELLWLCWDPSPASWLHHSIAVWEAQDQGQAGGTGHPFPVLLKYLLNLPVLLTASAIMSLSAHWVTLLVCIGDGSAPISPAPCPLDIVPHSPLGVLLAPAADPWAEQPLPTAQMVPVARGKGGETCFGRGRSPTSLGEDTDRAVSVVELKSAGGASVAGHLHPRNGRAVGRPTSSTPGSKD